MALRVQFRGKDRPSDNPYAMCDDNGGHALALESRVELRIDPIAKQLQRITPRTIECEGGHDHGADDPAFLPGGFAEAEIRRELVFQRRELAQVPDKAPPAHDFHETAF